MCARGRGGGGGGGGGGILKILIDQRISYSERD